MTYVYIVKEDCYYGSSNCLHGIFSTQEKAQAYIDATMPEDERNMYEIHMHEVK